MSMYAFLSKDEYEQVASELKHGVRFSLDGSEVVAKLSDGQEIEGATIQTHEQTLETIQGPAWSPGEPGE